MTSQNGVGEFRAKSKCLFVIAAVGGKCKDSRVSCAARKRSAAAASAPRSEGALHGLEAEAAASPGRGCTSRSRLEAPETAASLGGAGLTFVDLARRDVLASLGRRREGGFLESDVTADFPTGRGGGDYRR